MDGKELIGRWLHTGEAGPLAIKKIEHFSGTGCERVKTGEDVRATLPPDAVCEVMEAIRKLSPLCRIAGTEFHPDYRGGDYCKLAVQVEFDDWWAGQPDGEIGRLAEEMMALKFAPALEQGFVEGQGGPGVPQGMMKLDVSTKRATLSPGSVWELLKGIEESHRYPPSVSFLCSHRTDFKLRQVKLRDFTYLWQPSTTSEYHAKIFDRPLYVSGHLPDDVLIAGDFRKALSLVFFENGFSIWKDKFGLRMQMMVEAQVDPLELHMLDWR